jgi:hypothetical protein
MTRTASRLLVVVAVLLGCVALGGPASAHVGVGAAGSDFDGRVVSVAPEMPGVHVRILQFGDEFELVNDSGTEVTVPGYSDEPYLRIGPDGVWRNAHSPATYINRDRYGRTALPESADPDAEPEWVQVSTEPHYVWHDHRTHWMSERILPPQVAAAPDRGHTVSEWTVPLRHGDTPVEVSGVLTWSPPPSPWLIWPVYGALLPAGIAVLVAGLGFRASRRGRGAMTGLLAVVLGWLLLVQGLPDVDALWTANVLSAGPQPLARAAVAVLVAIGAGLVAGGIAAVRRFREADETRPGRLEAAPTLSVS